MSEKSIRAAQLISPFGPGAIVDVGNESFTCMTIDCWPVGECMPLPQNALQRALGLVVRCPPTEAQHGAVPFTRFPRWVFCPTCHRLYNYSRVLDERNEFATPTCTDPACKQASLVPMRFIAACEQGHLQDVDWHSWAHRNSQASQNGQCGRQTANLYFHTSGASGGDFNAMSIRCASCGATNTFEGLTSRPYPFKCHGRQPWEAYREPGSCDLKPRVFPRAASNVYYAQGRSALDITSEPAGAQGRGVALAQWLDVQPAVQALRSLAVLIPDWQGKRNLFQHIVDEAMRKFGMREDECVSAIAAAVAGATQAHEQAQGSDKTQHGFLRAEWPHLARDTPATTDNFKTEVQRTQGTWPAAYSAVFPQVTLVHRLREIRALLGFKRVKPDNSVAEVPVDLGKGLDWLPGVETFGEGIFIKLSELHLSRWEKQVAPLVEARTQHLSEACTRWGREPAHVYASPRFIALHTLAHGLIRRLAFDAGYSSSSIRERIYADQQPTPAAGLLLYTSDGDSEGSLGGLVRQGLPERFLATLQRALSDLSWCSADPVCSELEHQGVDGMNSAACHACSLVSETSCTFNNSLLDRRMLVGSPDGRIPGLLSALLATGQD